MLALQEVPEAVEAASHGAFHPTLLGLDRPPAAARLPDQRGGGDRRRACARARPRARWRATSTPASSSTTRRASSPIRRFSRRRRSTRTTTTRTTNTAPARPAAGRTTLPTFVAPGVLLAAFALALVNFLGMLGVELHEPIVQTYWAWMPVGDLQIDAALQLDPLSLLMTLIITGVGSLIHVFSVGYMSHDPGYPRYLAYLNLFVFFMLIAGAGRLLPADVRRLGGRGALLLSADRLLVQREGERRRGQEGVHRQPDRRLRLPAGDVPDLRAPRRARLRGGLRAALPRRWRTAARWPRRSPSSSSSAPPARARRSRSTSGCRTRWRARRRCRR